MHLLKTIKYLTSGSFPGMSQGINSTTLASRSLIVVTGKETKQFLHGLTTNNILQLYQKSQINKNTKIAIYTLFLNPKGKVITDAIIFRPIKAINGSKKQPQDELWIDVSKQTSNILIKHLKKYTWKRQVEIQGLSQADGCPKIHVVYPSAMIQQKDNNQSYKYQEKAGFLQQNNLAVFQEDTYANISFYDPRSTKLGLRIVCDDEFMIENLKKEDQLTYKRYCLINGISSTGVMKNRLPFMFNSDLFNGFSFTKGCYIGQELVARAYHTGIVRRRILPFVLHDENQKLEEGTVIYDNKNNELGKVLESQNGSGTIISNYLPYIQKTWPIAFSAPNPGVVVMPFQRKLNQYIRQIKEKQSKLEQIDL